MEKIMQMFNTDNVKKSSPTKTGKGKKNNLFSLLLSKKAAKKEPKKNQLHQGPGIFLAIPGKTNVVPKKGMNNIAGLSRKKPGNIGFTPKTQRTAPTFTANVKVVNNLIGKAQKPEIKTVRPINENKTQPVVEPSGQKSQSTSKIMSSHVTRETQPAMNKILEMMQPVKNERINLELSDWADKAKHSAQQNSKADVSNLSHAVKQADVNSEKTNESQSGIKSAGKSLPTVQTKNEAGTSQSSGGNEQFQNELASAFSTKSMSRSQVKVHAVRPVFLNAMIEQIDKVRSLAVKAPKGSASFTFNDSKIGQLEIRFQSNSGQHEVANIYVEHEAAKQSVQQAIPQILQSLEQKGYAHLNLNVSVQNSEQQAANEMAGQSGRQKQQSSAQGRAFAEDFQSDENESNVQVRNFGYNSIEVTA